MNSIISSSTNIALLPVMILSRLSETLVSVLLQIVAGFGALQMLFGYMLYVDHSGSTLSELASCLGQYSQFPP